MAANLFVTLVLLLLVFPNKYALGNKSFEKIVAKSSTKNTFDNFSLLPKEKNDMKDQKLTNYTISLPSLELKTSLATNKVEEKSNKSNYIYTITFFVSVLNVITLGWLWIKKHNGLQILSSYFLYCGEWMLTHGDAIGHNNDVEAFGSWV